MILILIAAAIISGITAFYQGESFADVIIIIAVVIINAVLGVVQEGKAEAAIAALQEIAAASSKVLRDGKIVTLKSEDLVPGDIVVLEAGDAVPADGRIIESASMKIEEAALTGESVPVIGRRASFPGRTEGHSPGRQKEHGSAWAPPWYTDEERLSSLVLAWTQKWVRSPLPWPRPRMRRPPSS